MLTFKKTCTMIFVMYWLLIPIQTMAQNGGQNPLYVECGAEEYLQYRDQTLENMIGINSIDQESIMGDDQTLVNLVMVVRAARESLIFITDLPSCVATLHQVTLNQLATTSDYLAVISISLAYGNSDSTYLSELSQLAAAIEVLNGIIVQSLNHLGWQSDLTIHDPSSNQIDNYSELMTIQDNLASIGLSCLYIFRFRDTYGYISGYDLACRLPLNIPINQVKDNVAQVIADNAIIQSYWIRVVLSNVGEGHAYFYTSDKGWLNQTLVDSN